MKSKIRSLFAAFVVILMTINIPLTAFAHGGRTDSSGGHKDNKNKSGLGSYHYHCGGYPAHLHDGGYCPYTDVFPSSVRVKAEKTTLGIGEKVSIEGSVYPENSVNTSVTWACSDDSVIKLTDGMIEAVGYGTAVITVTSFNGKVGTVTITVKEIVANSVTVSAPDLVSGEVYIGDGFQLNATTVPEKVDNPTITWRSSDENIAKVSTTGLVTPLTAGTAIITAEASNGVSGKYEVTIKEKAVESVVIENGEKVDLLLSDSVALLGVVLPEDASFPEITWSTSDSSVATVSEEGVVTAVGCGSATITATVSSGLFDDTEVEVTEIVAERIDVQGESSIYIGAETDLVAVFSPVDTTVQNVEWISSDASVASIDENGHVSAHGVGAVTITALGKDVSTDYSLVVEPIAVEYIEISSTAGDDFKAGETAAFSARVYPENATYPEITWSTSNPKIATINSDGILTAEKAGTVIVTAQSTDGCIKEYELSVSLSDEAIGIITGGSGALGVGAIALIFLKKRKKKDTDYQEPDDNVRFVEPSNIFSGGEELKFGSATKSFRRMNELSNTENTVAYLRDLLENFERHKKIVNTSNDPEVVRDNLDRLLADMDEIMTYDEALLRKAGMTKEKMPEQKEKVLSLYDVMIRQAMQTK